MKIIVVIQLNDCVLGVSRFLIVFNNNYNCISMLRITLLLLFDQSDTVYIYYLLPRVEVDQLDPTSIMWKNIRYILKHFFYFSCTFFFFW